MLVFGPFLMAARCWPPLFVLWPVNMARGGFGALARDLLM